MHLRLLQIFCLLLLLQNENAFGLPEPSQNLSEVVGDRICHSSLRLSETDTVSDLLFKVGVGNESTEHRLYGPSGWVERNRILNGLTDEEWQAIGPGQTIDLYWPTEAADEDACAALGNEIKTYIKNKTTSYEIYFYLYKRIDNLRTVSQDVYDLIKPLNDNELHLYGPNGLFAKMLPYNIESEDPQAAKLFRDKIIALPRAVNLPNRKTREISEREDLEQPPTTPPLNPPVSAEPPADKTVPPLTADEEKIIADPDAASFAEIAALPPEARAQIPEEVISEKLDAYTISILEDDELETIPPSVVEEKAWDYSLFDLNKPGMTPLFKNLSLSTPSGYLGLRYGRIIPAAGNGFLAQLQTFGLLAEVRSGWFDGLRLIYDTTPEISGDAEAPGAVEQVGFSKLLMGWAFAWQPERWIDRIHLVPRVGVYNVKARYSPAAKNATARQVEITRALSTGLEVDAEWTRFFYTLRLWAGQDWTPELFSRGRSAQSRRAGLDVFLKGPGFGSGKNKMSLFYLLYATNEEISAVDSTGTNDGSEASDIKLVLPTAGLGLALTW